MLSQGAENLKHELAAGRVGRQVQQASATGFDESGQPVHLMGRQVVEHDHVAGLQSGAQHLAQVSGKNSAVNGPAPGHGRLQPGWGQGRHERHVEPAVQGRELVDPLPALGAGVAPVIGQVGAGFIHEFEPGEIFRLQRFDKGPPQLRAHASHENTLSFPKHTAKSVNHPKIRPKSTSP